MNGWPWCVCRSIPTTNRGRSRACCRFNNEFVKPAARYVRGQLMLPGSRESPNVSDERVRF
jgi:hypothetical protein